MSYGWSLWVYNPYEISGNSVKRFKNLNEDYYMNTHIDSMVFL
jgi:hypothetical protein